MKPVPRPARQPADAIPAAEPEAEAQTPTTATKSEERNVSRRPQRIVSRIGHHRTGPPDPVPAVNEPAPIVIRRPAPRLVRDPGPAIVGFPDPAAVAIGRPTGIGGARSPNRTIIGNLAP